MPSPNPTIAVRLDPEMFAKVKQLAVADGRSMSNFVEYHLRRMLGPNLEPIFTSAQQLDIEEQIARTKPRRKRPAKRK